MIVEYLDASTPRVDSKPGSPTSMTVGELYPVVEIEHDKYTVLNDEGKLGRYLKSRFRIVENTPPLPLREQFNSLTSKMREDSKRYQRIVDKLKEIIL